MFNRKELIVLKEADNIAGQIAKLTELSGNATGSLKAEIENQIFLLQKGIAGEDEILFQLKYCDLDMIVLRDLHLEIDNLTAQIDYYIVTPKLNFILECKNLVGDISVDSKGNFVRTYNDYKGKAIKEGIESPISQNERHMKVLKDTALASKGLIGRLSVKTYFEDFYIPLVVLANNKTILNARRAPRAVRDKIIKIDQLNDTIKRLHKESNNPADSKANMMKRAQRILDSHTNCEVDYTKSFEEKLNAQQEKKQNIDDMICPFCGNELVARNGKNGEFIGCKGYPKCRFTRNIKKS